MGFILCTEPELNQLELVSGYIASSNSYAFSVFFWHPVCTHNSIEHPELWTISLIIFVLRQVAGTILLLNSFYVRANILTPRPHVVQLSMYIINRTLHGGSNTNAFLALYIRVDGYIKVYITSVGILNVCNLWILLRKIVIYLVGRKCHLHGRQPRNLCIWKPLYRFLCWRHFRQL